MIRQRRSGQRVMASRDRGAVKPKRNAVAVAKYQRLQRSGRRTRRERNRRRSDRSADNADRAAVSADRDIRASRQAGRGRRRKLDGAVAITCRQCALCVDRYRINGQYGRAVVSRVARRVKVQGRLSRDPRATRHSKCNVVAVAIDNGPGRDGLRTSRDRSTPATTPAYNADRLRAAVGRAGKRDIRATRQHHPASHKPRIACRVPARREANGQLREVHRVRSREQDGTVGRTDGQDAITPHRQGRQGDCAGTVDGRVANPVNRGRRSTARGRSGQGQCKAITRAGRRP